MSEEMETPVVKQQPETIEKAVANPGGITSEKEMQIIKEMADRHEQNRKETLEKIETKEKGIFKKFAEFFSGNKEAALSKLIDSKTTWGITAEEKATIMAAGAQDNYEGTVGYNSETGKAYYKPSKDVRWNGPGGGAGLGAA
jgi:malate synthase